MATLAERAADSMAMESATAYLREVLRKYGLEDLVEWAREELAKGYDDAVVLQHLRQTPQFKERFKVITERERLGLPPMAPEEVVQYEANALEVLSRAGLPVGFWDDPKTDFVDFMVRDVSIDELKSRIQSGYNRVNQAPPEVRDTFREFFGVDGDAALAAFMLDADRAMPILETMISTAELGGTARRYGISMDQTTSEQLARTGTSVQAAEQKLTELGDMRGLYQENMNESQDLEVDREGVQAAFGLDPEARQKVAARSGARQAAFSGSGGAVAEREGISGLGRASR